MFASSFRVPDDIAELLRAEAVKNKRSLNRELLIAIEMYLGIRRRKPKVREGGFTRSGKVMGKEQVREYRTQRAAKRRIVGLDKGDGSMSGSNRVSASLVSIQGAGPVREDTGRCEFGNWEQWPVLLAQFQAEYRRMPRPEELVPYWASKMRR